MNNENFSVRFENRFIMVNYDVIMRGLLTAYEIAVYVTLCAYATSYSTLAGRVLPEHGAIRASGGTGLY